MTENILPVLENTSLVKDKINGALLNVNSSALESYKKQKMQFNRSVSLEKEVLQLKNDINEIKSLLISILESKNANSSS